MKAIRVHQTGGPEVLRFEETRDPVVGAGEVLIRMRAAGVNPVDTYVRSGSYERSPTLPYIPGGDGAGTVESIGDGVTRFSEGDRVYTAGAVGGLLEGSYAELMVCLESQVQPLPSNVSFAQGAAVGVPYATAYRALFQRAEARPGETVFVHGASGGVGLAAVQWAAARGLRIAGSASTEEGRALVRAQGADLVLDHSTADYLETLKEWTEGRGVNVLLEMVAHLNLENDLGVIAKGGRIVVIGNRGTVEINARGLMVQDAAILGVALSNASPEDMASIHASLVSGLTNGTLRPVVGPEFPLENADQAHREVLKSGVYGKVVLTMS